MFREMALMEKDNDKHACVITTERKFTNIYFTSASSNLEPRIALIPLPSNLLNVLRDAAGIIERFPRLARDIAV